MMIERLSMRPTRTRFANAALHLAGGAVVASLVIVGTTGAISTQAVAQQQAVRAHSVSLIDTSHRASIASLREDVADAALNSARATASAELSRAAGILSSSAGKASPQGRMALSAAIATVTARLAGSSGYRLTGAVMSLRESEKAVTDSVTAWQKAEDARLAAAAAAHAAAIAAQEYVNAQHAAATSSDAAGSSPGSSDAAASRAVTRSASTYYAPGVSHTRPSNDPCGPCPGATLVLIEGYWGCP